jgi:hypothetical protein
MPLPFRPSHSPNAEKTVDLGKGFLKSLISASEFENSPDPYRTILRRARTIRRSPAASGIRASHATAKTAQVVEFQIPVSVVIAAPADQNEAQANAIAMSNRPTDNARIGAQRIGVTVTDPIG